MDGPPGEGIARLKIIDFGTARYFRKGERLTGIYGSSYYVAPEMISESDYDQKVDVFSVGVILHLMMTQKMPFTGPTDEIILKKVKAAFLDFEAIKSKHSVYCFDVLG